MNERTESMKAQGLATQGYNFTPHCGRDERARRIRQIIRGRLDVSAEARLAAWGLYREWFDQPIGVK